MVRRVKIYTLVGRRGWAKDVEYTYLKDSISQILVDFHPVNSRLSHEVFTIIADFKFEEYRKLVSTKSRNVGPSLTLPLLFDNSIVSDIKSFRFHWGTASSNSINSSKSASDNSSEKFGFLLFSMVSNWS